MCVREDGRAVQASLADERTQRTRRAVRSVALAVTVLLGACAPVDGAADRPPDRPPVQVDASLGVVRIAPGTPVGLRIVLDGVEDPEGLAAVLEAAFRTAVEDFGAVQQGFRVDLGQAITTGCSGEDGVRAAQSIIDAPDAEQVVGVLGPQCSATLLGLQGPASAAGLTVVSPRPSDLTLTVGADGVVGQDRAAGMWRTAPSLLQEAQAAAEHAAEGLGLSRAVTLHDGSIGSTGLASAFRTRFEALGGTVVVDRLVEADLTGDDEARAEAALDALLDAIVDGTVDVAFLPLPIDMLLALADGWADRSRLAGVTRLTTSVAGVADFLGDAASEGHLLTGPVLAFPDAVSAVTGMSASQTSERVSSMSGVRAPDGWWAYAYDAATLLLKAIEDSSLIDVDGSLVLSRAELRATLARTTFGGMTGQVSCSPFGDCAARRTAVRAHDDASIDTLAALPVVAELGG
jgi:branched-chain amino acid transport system substrate-binding protein